jgi:hypothetical protein
MFDSADLDLEVTDAGEQPNLVIPHPYCSGNGGCDTGGDGPNCNPGE